MQNLLRARSAVVFLWLILLIAGASWSRTASAGASEAGQVPPVVAGPAASAAAGQAASPEAGLSPATMTSVAFQPDGRRVAFGHTDGTVTIHDVDGWREITRFAADTTALTALAFSPDGTLMATAGSHVRIFDSDTWTCRADLTTGAGPVAFATSGRELVTGVVGGRGLRFYTVTPEGLAALATTSTHVGQVRALSAQATTVAAAKGEWEVRLWSIPPKGALVRGPALKNAGLWGGISQVTISPDGTRIATLGSTQSKPPQGEATVYDTATGQQVGFCSSGYFTTASAFTTDAALFAVAGSFEQQAELGVMDVGTGKTLWHHGSMADPPVVLPEIRLVAFSPDQRILLTVGGGCLRAWDARTGAQRFAAGNPAPAP